MFSLAPRPSRLLLAAVLASLVGCGHAPVNATQAAAQAATVLDNQGHKTGFDLARYALQAPKAHLQHLPHQGLLPTSIDMRAKASPVVDQGDLGACTAFAVGKGLREFLEGAHATPLSALFLYYETRKVRGPNAVNNDSGGTVTDAMTAIAHTGIPPEAQWPYDMAQFAVEPPADAYLAAEAYTLKTGLQLATLDDMKTALAAHQPVVCGMKLYPGFGHVDAKGLLPLPQPGEVVVGGHAVAVLGYDDRRQVLIVKNSFGTQWGDHGYFYMPYAYVTTGNALDIWTAQ